MQSNAFAKEVKTDNSSGQQDNNAVDS